MILLVLGSFSAVVAYVFHEAIKIREESEEESNSLEGMSNIGPSEHDLQQEEEKHIIEAISNHFVFKDINQELLSLVLNDLIYFQFDKGQTIYAEGDEGNYF